MGGERIVQKVGEVKPSQSEEEEEEESLFC